MKRLKWMGAAVALGIAANTLPAQTASNDNEVLQLQEQLKQMQEQFQRQQELFQRQMKAMQEKIDSLQKAQSNAETAQTQLQGEQAELKRMMETKLSEPAPLPGALTPGLQAPGWNPADPIRVFGNANQYVNVSFDGLMAMGASTANDVAALNPGGHDPSSRGFTLQQAEVAFTGAVDPYFRGLANIVHIISGGETVVELEEAYLESTSLPWNLQLKAGQFFTEFGRQNPTHPHSWGFVDQPLINNRLFGGDGQRGPGARLSWLAPTPFYSELRVALQNTTGPTAPSFRSDQGGGAAFGRFHTGNRSDAAMALRDLIISPRYEASIDLADEYTLLAGVSGSFGANATGTDTDTRIYGADLMLKWKSAHHEKGFPFVSWQTEVMLRQYEAGAYTDDLAAGRDLFNTGVVDTAPAETIEDYGLYSHVLWGFRPGWVAGFRADYVAPTRAQYERLFGVDPDRDRRWRLSPNLTWYPSEFSKTRLQYNYDWRDNIGPDHSLWLQFEILLGAHGAHKF